MFRLVLTYQLVLSLLVGPMLCCCTAARLGHESASAVRSQPVSEKSGRKSCCGEQKSQGSGEKAPGEKPSDPSKCPCKDGSAKAVSVPETASTQADSLSLLGEALAALDLPACLDAVVTPLRVSQPVDGGSSFLSVADILFAHHNLRC